MRRMLLVVAVVALLLVVLAALYDRPPVAPGSWLQASGLQARFEVVGGHRLRFVRAGTGPSIVLVHGFASSLYTWKDVLPALAPSHDVVALDLPGFGASDLPADLSFEGLPAAVLGLMDRLDIRRAALVGNSMGGAVAAIVAAEHPQRASALVLIDAAGFNLEPSDRPAMMRLATSPAARLLEPLPGKRFLVERALHEVFHDPRLVTDERLSEYLSGALRRGSFAARASLLRSLESRPGAVQESLPGIEAPTLVIWGREDTWIPLAHADLFVEAIPGARKVVLDDCGHVPQEEKPGEVGDLLGEFLAPSSSEAGEATSSRG